MSDEQRVKRARRLIEQDVLDAEFFFKQDKYRDCIQKLFQVYENCLNTIKDCLNGRGPLTEHEGVTQQLLYYFEMGFLKKDYSKNHKRLDELRKLASFGPYTKYKTKPANINEIREMLEKAKSLVKETRERMKMKKW